MALRDISNYFRECGRNNETEVLAALDDLTKRVTDKDYPSYIQRIARNARTRNSYIAVKVKKADLEDNMDPARNPNFNLQTIKDKVRLVRYEVALKSLNDEFPDIVPRAKPHKQPQVRAVKGRRPQARVARVEMWRRDWGGPA